LPLESIHKQALKAHEAANCAGDQGKYWEMHDQLFANQRKLRRKDLPEYAKAIGLNVAAFESCLDSDKHAGEIRKDVETAAEVGIRGTPTFLLGYTQSDPSKVQAVRMIRGAQPYSQFRKAFDELLNSKDK
nr:thioredoxin domain-containing protein [Deltaproteobacteria bacterium]